MSVRFTRYGPCPSGTNAPDLELANKTAAFFLISNPGPRTVSLYTGQFAWSGHSYVSTQVRLGLGWTDARPEPASHLHLCRELAAGTACEVPVVLGTRLLGTEYLPGPPVPVATTNLVWRVGVRYRPVDLAEQLGLDRLLLRLGGQTPGGLRRWLWWSAYKKLMPEHMQQIWSDPVVPPLQREGHLTPPALYARRVQLNRTSSLRSNCLPGGGR